MKRPLFTLGLIATLFGAVSPALAEGFDPTGYWEANDGESRYHVELCGDGTQLCGTLIWIRPDVTTEMNRPYINTKVVNGAQRVRDGQWRGDISLYGHTVSGSVTRTSENGMVVRGCALLIICVNKAVTRISPEQAGLATKKN